MIVRILGEGQLDLDDGVLEHVNTLDGVLEDAVESGDEDAFREALITLLDTVREHGQRLPNDVLLPSQAVLPAPGTSLAEVRKLLGDEGLIPG